MILSNLRKLSKINLHKYLFPSIQERRPSNPIHKLEKIVSNYYIEAKTFSFLLPIIIKGFADSQKNKSFSVIKNDRTNYHITFYVNYQKISTSTKNI